jgi:hypothetical protein
MSVRPETTMHERLAALCERLVQEGRVPADFLDAVLRRLEARLLEYRRQGVGSLEEDAFVRLREDAWDPVKLSELIEGLPLKATGVSLFHRMVAIFAASGIIYLAQSLLFALVTVGLVSLPGWRGDAAFPRSVGALLMALLSLLSLAPLAMLLAHWQRGLEAGRRFWFTRWPAHLAVALVLLLLLLQRLVPFAHAAPLLTLPEYTAKLWGVFLIFLAIGQASLVGTALLWFWWCDRPPRRPHALTWALGAWLAAYVLYFVMPPVQVHLVPAGWGLPLEGLMHYRILAHGFYAGGRFEWYIAFDTPGWFRVYAAVQVLVMCVFSGYVGLVLYRFARRRGRFE